jgi:trans-aconitate 2-methyltransferase
MDSSPDMLSKARKSLPDVEFVQGDLATYKPGGDADLLFSNAVFHWLRSDTRIPTLTTLFHSLKPGGVIAIQVPANYHESSHVLMRDTALMPDREWSASFAGASTISYQVPTTPSNSDVDCHIGLLTDSTRPDLDPIEPSSSWYNALSPHASSVNIWTTRYEHVLADAGAIVEWVKGTGLQPYLNRIADAGAREAYLTEYERRIGEAYPTLQDGRVMLGYPRLFVVAVRK